mmetsp:Transcript_108878/g.307893  ORF Transcript_108878/g.307893 Transcript_108878/m.307893 type:complete len:214 (-) Transcript_108878:66-707(-)
MASLGPPAQAPGRRPWPRRAGARDLASEPTRPSPPAGPCACAHRAAARLNAATAGAPGRTLRQKPPAPRCDRAAGRGGALLELRASTENATGLEPPQRLTSTPAGLLVRLLGRPWQHLRRKCPAWAQPLLPAPSEAALAATRGRLGRGSGTWRFPPPPSPARVGATSAARAAGRQRRAGPALRGIPTPRRPARRGRPVPALRPSFAPAQAPGR